MNSFKSIAIIGSGNMGASLLSGFINQGYSPDALWIADPDIEKLTALKQQFNLNITCDNTEAASAADVIIFAVKPNLLVPIAASLKSIIQSRQSLIISVAAGLRCESIQKAVGEEIAIIRAMPNTPALIGCGATALFANDYANETHKALADSLLTSVGLVVWVPEESQMDNITALSGSGPAYFFLMMEALQNAAINSGLSPETARILTLQTAYGASRMALESDVDVIELRKRVTSPGGTTQAAIEVMEKLNLKEIYQTALFAAKKRSEELAEQLDTQ